MSSRLKANAKHIHTRQLVHAFIQLLEELTRSCNSLLSDSGRSIAFDERGSGFGRGEGCGIIVLKPLDQAIKDGDAIRAVIRGTGINQDGNTAGITMPNGDAQGRRKWSTGNSQKGVTDADSKTME